MSMVYDYLILRDEQVMFLVGDMNGTERCANITIIEDFLVENEEEFMVTLAIVTDKPNLLLGNATTTVTIIDSNGMIQCMPFFSLKSYYIYPIWICTKT